MRAELDALADLLAEAVADATCEVSDVIVTAGRPAAPSTEGRECQTVIYVFGDNVTDDNQTSLDDSCIVLSRWAMLFEIQTCYPEDWEDQIGTEDASTAADCLYELMRLAWCALVEAKDTNYFCDCRDIELVPLQVQNRQGGSVSALGGVTIPYDCTEETSPTSP